jgi:prephenate dehydrogenase
MKTAFNVVIIGVGLIGGSVSLALKAGGVANEILGVDRAAA